MQSKTRLLLEDNLRTKNIARDNTRITMIDLVVVVEWLLMKPIRTNYPIRRINLLRLFSKRLESGICKRSLISFEKR